MLTILLHTSKTMRTLDHEGAPKAQVPILHKEAAVLNTYLQTLSLSQIGKVMAISDKIARFTKETVTNWSTSGVTLPALDIFLGDIYSGLQVQAFSTEDRTYANDHLYILSGLYGVLRALDGIKPYRLEMGYKFPGNGHNHDAPDIKDLYTFWGDKIAHQLPKHQNIINLSAKEYTKAVLPYLKDTDGLKDVKVISPKFLTVSPKTGEPTFVTVHAKIARGAFARWLIQNRVEGSDTLKEFNDLGYKYAEVLSTPEEPVFVAREFDGLGLSVRLS